MTGPHQRWAVTAGAGFLGRALTQSLVDAGHEVLCLDRPDRVARTGRVPGATYVDFVLGECPDARALLEDVEVMAHLAHRGLPSSPREEAASDAGTNVRGLVQLLEAASNLQLPTVLFASSGGAVYGAVGHMPVDESTLCRPISGYGAAKLMLEDWVAHYDRAHGVRGVSLRIGNAVGPGQLSGAGVGAPAKFLSEVAAGRDLVIWGGGGIVRDYIDVDDVVTAFLSAAAGTTSGSFNVGTGVGTSLTQLVDVIQQVTGLPVTVRHEPTRAFDVPANVLNSSRLSRETGWAPQHDLHASVERMWRTLSDVHTR